MKVITVGDIARNMGAKAAAMRHHLGASHRQTETVHEPAPRPKRISRGARARAAKATHYQAPGFLRRGEAGAYTRVMRQVEVVRMPPACVIKSMRRIAARRADGRWDGIVR